MMVPLDKKLQSILPTDRIKARLIDRYAYASDASHFYLVPKAVVQPISIDEIQKLFQFSHRESISLTFRAAGTSLSGQAVTDGILVDLSNYWRQILPEENGEQVRVQPAAIGANVNRALKPFARKIGPDPASINAAMMGGILSNNSSGMCCGVIQNSYHTLRSMTFVLPNGLVFDSAALDAHSKFETEASDIANEIRTLRHEILNNPRLLDRIRKKYKQKNTVGYGLNAFVDYEHPLDILTHLIIGGEGTLAFIAEAVLNTVPDLPYKMTGMLYFDNPKMACDCISALKATGAEALEFMDRASLRSVENMAGVPTLLTNLPNEASAILCEFQESSQDKLLAKFENARQVFSTLPLIVMPHFTQDLEEQAMMWKIRKGMYPSVAGMRASGTSALLEDFTFPVERLGDAVVDIQQLFKQFNYENAILFGHAKDGNLHFVVSQRFFSQEDIDHYEKFNNALFDIILNKYDGALKGEHSSGRAVSAFIEKEWGREAYAIMKRLKNVIDPTNLLNPGIIITEDKLTHIHNLKMMPVVEQEVDKCIECGFCEQVCPSRDLTMTPRRRIGVRRAIKRLEMQGEHQLKNELLKDYKYDGLETCAVDGMCALNCPVDINTGDLVKRLRRENHSSFQNRTANVVARNFALFEYAARAGVATGIFLNRIGGKNFMKKFTGTVKKVIPAFPSWSNHIKHPGGKIDSHLNGREVQSVVYFSSCISRMMGGEIMNLFSSLCKKASVNLIVPKDIKGACCGQIFSSKGFTNAYAITANNTVEKLWQWTKQGMLPVIMDVTSCTQTLKGYKKVLSEENANKYEGLKFLDIIDFAADTLLPRLMISKPKDRIAFHPVCSAFKMGTVSKLQKIGSVCAVKYDIPLFAKCCGMAGDRGFYFPELTASATKLEADEVKQKEYDGYYSSSTTCEMALSEAVGKEYESILKLLDEVSD
jgi:D-lactate dehydrogenase